MDGREHITVNPAVLHGKACIRGRRIPVALDFADIRAYPPDEYVGIVVLRPAEPNRRQHWMW